ncbi:Dihydrolipoyl dehydrogenase OS=Lysinibacillus sphaericus OX=1421 GN=LS41612_19075 PE=3 SV=1 [Lysinibacillus sphaericus]
MIGHPNTTLNVNFPRLMQRKNAVIPRALENIEHFIVSNHITFYRGEATIDAGTNVNGS